MYRSITAVSCKEHIISTPLSWVNIHSVTGWKRSHESLNCDVCMSWRYCWHYLLSFHLIGSIGSYKIALKLRCKLRKPMSKAWTHRPDGCSLVIVNTNYWQHTGRTKKKAAVPSAHSASLPRWLGDKWRHGCMVCQPKGQVQISLWKWQSSKGMIFLK